MQLSVASTLSAALNFLQSEATCRAWPSFNAALLHARHGAAHLRCLASLQVLPLCAASSSFLCFFYLLPRGAHTVCCCLTMIASTAPCFFLGSTAGRPSEPCRAASFLCAGCHLQPPRHQSAPFVDRVPRCLWSAPRRSLHCLAVHFAGLCRIAEHRAVVYLPRHRAEAAVCAQPPSSSSRRDAVRRAWRLCSALPASAPFARRSRHCQPPLVSLLPLRPLKLVKRASLVLLVLPSPVLAAGKPRMVGPLPPRRGCRHGRVPPLFGNKPLARFGRPICLG
jgi:hypothetical protein